MNQDVLTKPLLAGSELMFLRGDQFAPAASGPPTRVYQQPVARPEQVKKGVSRRKEIAEVDTD